MRTSELLKRLDVLVRTETDRVTLEELLKETERSYYLSQDRRFLPYLAWMYYRTGCRWLARYYYSESARSSNLADRRFDLGARLFPPEPCAGGIHMPGTEFFRNDLFQRAYSYQGGTYAYSVISFSETIGRNLTLLKTRHGAILFDCGAAYGDQGPELITVRELESFFEKYGIAVRDIQAALISHAHLDHYGSAAALLRLGVPAARIYMNAATKELLSVVTGKDFPTPRQFNSSRVLIPGGVIRISAFPNGHILGSEGYVVTFDGVNVVYTGDYCLHDQKTAPGLRPRDLLQLACVREHGIDCVITETTYGKRTRLLSCEDTQKVFHHVARNLIACGYKVLIPTFAVGRSQEIALLLNDSFQILISGPAAEISRVYAERAGLDIYNKNTRFDTGQQEQVLRNFGNHDVILTSPGMLTPSGVPDALLDGGSRTAVIRTGYSGSESYGTALLERWKKPVFHIALPSHADLPEIRQLLSALAPRTVVMIHGDGLLLAPATERDARPAPRTSLAGPPGDAPPAGGVQKEPETVPAGTPAKADSGRNAARTGERRKIRSIPNQSRAAARKSSYRMLNGTRFHIVQDGHPRRFTCCLCGRALHAADYAEFYAEGIKETLCIGCFAGMASDE